MRESSLLAGFNATIGVLLALLVVFVGLPILLCMGIDRWGGLQEERAAAVPAAEPVRFDPPRFRQADNPDPVRMDPEVERIAPGDRVWPADNDPKPVADPRPQPDPETAAARKLALARSLADPAKRRAWLAEIVRDYPDTAAAKEAAEVAGK